MFSTRILRPLVLACILAILLGSLGLAAVGRANAVLFNPKEYTISRPTTGAGTAGTDSIAVSASFATPVQSDPALVSGAGGFGGRLAAKGGLDFAVEGILSLTILNPASMPLLPCGPAGEIGASGAVISGIFQGDPVTVFGCIGSGVPGGIQIVDRLDPFKNFAYNGNGVGDGSTAQWPWLLAAASTGNTAGSGSAGAGTIAVAETVNVLLVNGIVQLQGGGAFVGTLNALPVSGTIIPKTAGIGNGCETDLVGVVSSGVFLGQPETTSFLPFQCQPTFQQQGRLLLDGIVSFAIGTPTNAVYIGKGPGQAFLIPRVGQEVIV